MIEHGRSIYEQEGAGALWAGVIPSLWLVSNPSVQFVVYERIRVYMTSVAERRKSAITAIEFFAMGALAKAAATYVTYPLQIAQSRLRADRKGKKDENGKMAPRKYKGTMDCLAKLLQKDGIQREKKLRSPTKTSSNVVQYDTLLVKEKKEKKKMWERRNNTKKICAIFWS